MCQATVYVGEEKIAEEVIRLQPVEDGVLLEAFFEEPQVVRGIIREIDFLKHRVQIEPVSEKRDE